MRTLFTSQPGEEIREIEDFPTYWASNLGRIISAPKLIRSGQNKWIVLRPNSHMEGYQIVTLCRVGHKHTKKIHDLVGKAFNDFSGLGIQWRHLDSDKTNNRADNLIWGTSLEDGWDWIVDNGRQEDWGVYPSGNTNNPWQLKMTIPGEGRKYIGVFPTMVAARVERDRLCILYGLQDRIGVVP